MNPSNFSERYPNRKVRKVSFNEYNQYLDRKLAHYNEWLCDKSRKLGTVYEGFPEDMEYVTMQSVMENMVEVLTGEQVVPEAAKPKAKKARATKVAKPAKKAKVGTKQEAAVEIFRRLKGVKNEVIVAIQNELGMSVAGATTYFYNAKKLA